MEQGKPSFQQTLKQTFDSLIGTWQGLTRTWFGPEQPAVEAASLGTVRALPGGQFLIFEYQSSLDEQPFQGIYLIGFNQFSHQVDASWADSFHMGTNLMASTGSALADGFSVLGHYQTEPGAPLWGWRTEFRVLGQDRWRQTAYNISPEGEESKAIETEFQRAGQ